MASDKGKSFPSETNLEIIGTGNSKFTKTDWNALREEWVTTNISLAGLARKYNIGFASLRNRYSRENWARSLEEYNALVDRAIDQARAKKAQELANRVLDLDEMVMTISERVLNVVADNIEKALITEKLPEADAIIGVMKEAMKTVRDAHFNVRLAGDKATTIIDTHGANTLSTEEEERIEKEISIITRTSRVSKGKFISDEKPEIVVDCDQSSSDAQE